MVSAALVVVLAWNLVTYPKVKEWRNLRPLVAPLVATLNLRQYWTMYAPHPMLTDAWHLMPALRRDGRRVHLLTEGPLSLAPPRDGPDHYGGFRWQEVIYRSVYLGKVERLFRYFCRTGPWLAIDLWTLQRPNQGTAATVDGFYLATRNGRWRCDDAPQSAVDAFRADIDNLMAPILADQPEDSAVSTSASGNPAAPQPNADRRPQYWQ